MYHILWAFFIHSQLGKRIPGTRLISEFAANKLWLLNNFNSDYYEDYQLYDDDRAYDSDYMYYDSDYYDSEYYGGDYDEYFDEYFESPTAQAIISDYPTHPLYGPPITAAEDKGIFVMTPDKSSIKVDLKDGGSHKPISWDLYLKQFKTNKITVRQAQAVCKLRKVAVNEILKSASKALLTETFDNIEDQPCWSSGGSNTLTSDYDFAYIPWHKPDKTLDMRHRFRRDMESIFKTTPEKGWDINYYISDGLVPQKCYEAIGNPALKAAFGKNGQGRKESWDAKEDIYLVGSTAVGAGTYNHVGLFGKWDYFIAWTLINKRIKAKVTRFVGNEVKLLKISKLFFHVLDDISKKTVTHWDLTSGLEHILDTSLLYAKTLLYWMSFYSDEKYVSNAAVQHAIWDSTDKLPNSMIYLAIIDNFSFIDKFYNKFHGEPKKNLFNFWNKCSKYIWRICDLLNRLDGSAKKSAFESLAGLTPSEKNLWLQKALKPKGTKLVTPAKTARDQTVYGGTIEDIRNGVDIRNNFYGWSKVWYKAEWGIRFEGSDSIEDKKKKKQNSKKIKGDIKPDLITGDKPKKPIPAEIAEARDIWTLVSTEYDEIDKLYKPGDTGTPWYKLYKTILDKELVWLPKIPDAVGKILETAVDYIETNIPDDVKQFVNPYADATKSKKLQGY